MTELAKTIAEIDALQEQIETLRKKANKDGWDAFNKVIPMLFEEYPGLTQLAIQGFTPGFNDGSPCVHRTYSYICNGDWADYDEDEYYNADKDDYVVVNKLTDDEESAIRNLLYKFEGILESQYGTNWEIFISKDASGKVSIKKDYYECGY